MSFWDKLLVTAGFGSAQVETQLERTRFVPGDLLRGVATVQGGKVAQPVEDVYLDLVCSYFDGDEVRAWHSLFHHRLFEAFEIQPGEKREFPFEVRLPFQTPLTFGGAPVFLKTGLDIPLARDPRDMDPVQVGPNEFQEGCFKALRDLGFTSVRADCHRFDANPGAPFLQVYEFRPDSGPFANKLISLSLGFRTTEEGLAAVLWRDDTLPGDEVWTREIVADPANFEEAIRNA